MSSKGDHQRVEQCSTHFAYQQGSGAVDSKVRCVEIHISGWGWSMRDQPDCLASNPTTPHVLSLSTSKDWRGG